MDPSGVADPHDSRPSMDHSEEDAALALLNVSRTFLAGDINPQGVMGNPPKGAEQTATRHSKRQPKPVKKHKNDVGGFEKKDYTQMGPVGGRGRGRSGRGPGRPPKSSYVDPGQPGMMPQYGYGYGAQMHPQYAPEYPPEYAPQYPPQYTPMYAPPPHVPGGMMPGGATPAHMMPGQAMPGGAYGQPYPGGGGAPPSLPGYGMPGMMPYYHQPPYGTHVPDMGHTRPPHMGMPHMGMPHPGAPYPGAPYPGAPHAGAPHKGMPVPDRSPQAPLPVAPVQPAKSPAQEVPHIGFPQPAGGSVPEADPAVVDIRQMQKHLDSAVAVIGRKAGEPDELDTLLPNWKIGNMYDSDLANKTVVDLADYTQDQLQDMADMTVQEARLPPLVQPRPGVRVSRVASYTGSKQFYAGKIYNSAAAGGGGHTNRGGAASTAPEQQGNAPTKGPSWATVLGNASSSGLQMNPRDSALAMQIASCWRNDNNAVWRLLGKAEPPVVERVQINFLRLILVVESMAGYRLVTGSERWGDVAAKFGIQGGPQVLAKAGHALRMVYMQYVTPLWTFLQPFLPPVEGA